MLREQGFSEDCDHHSEDVTDTFDHRRKYYRVLRPDSIEHKYREGLNCNDGKRDLTKLYWPLEADETEGGFYFTSAEYILEYMHTWGDRICEVTVPLVATIYLDCPCHDACVWRASDIILSQPKLITKDVFHNIILGGGVLTPDSKRDILGTIASQNYQESTQLTRKDCEEIVEYLNALPTRSYK